MKERKKKKKKKIINPVRRHSWRRISIAILQANSTRSVNPPSLSAILLSLGCHTPPLPHLPLPVSKGKRIHRTGGITGGRSKSVVAKRVVVFRLAAISDRILHPLSPFWKQREKYNTERSENFCLLISCRSRFLAPKFHERTWKGCCPPSIFVFDPSRAKGREFCGNLIWLSSTKGRKCRRSWYRASHGGRSRFDCVSLCVKKGMERNFLKFFWKSRTAIWIYSCNYLFVTFNLINTALITALWFRDIIREGTFQVFHILFILLIF